MNSAVATEKLAYFVEGSFPSPIACAFVALRRKEQQGERDLQLLAALLEETLHFLGVVALCDASASPGEHAEWQTLRTTLEDPAGLAKLSRPVSAGSWARLLREGLAALRGAGREPLVRGLDAWHAGSGSELVNRAVALRNKLHAGQADYGDLQGAVMQLLGSLPPLSAVQLVEVVSSKLVDGLRRVTVNAFVGVSPVKREIDLSLELEAAKVYLLAAGTRETLALDPCYASLACADCSGLHLFALTRIERRKGTYAAVGVAHSAASDHAALALRALLAGSAGRRAEARYLAIADLPSTSSAPSLGPGERVGDRYVVEELLGEGGMGEVYRARDLVQGSAVALKVLPYKLLRDRVLVERFRAEAMQAVELEHPNIVKVLDHGEVRGDHFLALELAPGWPLPNGARAIDLSRLPLPLDETLAVGIAQRLLDALDYLHARQVVHRDVKPANVLLFEGGAVKLTDFGIARSRESMTLTLTGLTVGTPEYMSPEQADGARDLDGRSDLYSLAVVLYQLLGGALPFQASSPLGHALKHKDPRERAPRLAGVHPGLAAVVARALEKEPARRFPSARAFYEALGAHRERAEAAEDHVVAYLELLAGARAGTKHELTGRTRSLTIGSGPTCELQLEGEDLASMHALLRQTGEGFLLIDASGLPGGLDVNGVTLPTTLLRDGDMVRLGRARLRFVRLGSTLVSARPPTA